MSGRRCIVGALCGLLWLLLGSPAGQGALAAGAAPLELTFLGNEGFLLESSGRKVLVDALVATTHRQYVWQGDALRAELAAAKPPFDDVDLVVSSHFHGDHFDPQQVGRHLVASPKTRFLSTPDAVARLRDEFSDYERIRDRVVAELPADGEVRSLPELGVEVVRLHHGRDRPELQNLGLVIDVGGWRVGHVGDTEATAAEFRAAGYPRQIDVGLFAAWLFDRATWEGVVDGAVRARYWVPTHMASGEGPGARRGRSLDEWQAEFQAKWPDGIVFRHLLETRRLEP